MMQAAFDKGDLATCKRLLSTLKVGQSPGKEQRAVVGG